VELYLPSPIRFNGVVLNQKCRENFTFYFSYLRIHPLYATLIISNKTSLPCFVLIPSSTAQRNVTCDAMPKVFTAVNIQVGRLLGFEAV